MDTLMGSRIKSGEMKTASCFANILHRVIFMNAGNSSKLVKLSIRNNQQMQLYAVNFIPLLSSLYMFRAAHTPIIRSTKFNCIYSH